MEFGIHFVNFNLPGGPHTLGPTMAATARTAEQGGATMFTLTSSTTEFTAHQQLSHPPLPQGSLPPEPRSTTWIIPLINESLWKRLQQRGIHDHHLLTQLRWMVSV
jgi:hypothetical protein